MTKNDLASLVHSAKAETPAWVTDEKLIRQEEAERVWEAVCPENVSTRRGLGELRWRGEAPEGQDSQLPFFFFFFNFQWSLLLLLPSRFSRVRLCGTP